MKDEFRGFEVRREGRRLTGTAVKYGDIARIGMVRERFLPGAFGDLSNADVMLNQQHERAFALARTGGGGLTLRDGDDSLEIEAELPETRRADEVIALVKHGVLRGLSIEFRALEEQRIDGVRVIVRASLRAVAVVDSGAYPASAVAARETPRRLKRRYWL